MRNTNINRLNKEIKEMDEIINSLIINNTKIIRTGLKIKLCY